MCLHNSHFSIHINYQPGKRISLSMNKTVTGSLMERERAAQNHGAGKSLKPEPARHLSVPVRHELIRKTQDPHCDGTFLPVPYCQKAAVV